MDTDKLQAEIDFLRKQLWERTKERDELAARLKERQPLPWGSVRNYSPEALANLQAEQVNMQRGIGNRPAYGFDPTYKQDAKPPL